MFRTHKEKILFGRMYRTINDEDPHYLYTIGEDERASHMVRAIRINPDRKNEMNSYPPYIIAEYYDLVNDEL